MKFVAAIKIKNYIIIWACIQSVCAVTMQQFEQSLEMMRGGCAPKFKIPVELLDKLRGGEFTEGNAELKCYTRCIAQLAGTLTKKGDFSIQKALAQIPIILPAEIQEVAKEALNSCKDVRTYIKKRLAICTWLDLRGPLPHELIEKAYKDTCERVYYTTKCVRDYDPSSFKFP